MLPLTHNPQRIMATYSAPCAICGKSIHKKTSIKRHERYCRSMLRHPAPPRRKACLGCIKAKSRCDLRMPGCGLCQRKGRRCIYLSETVSSRGVQSTISPAQSGSGQQSPDSTPVTPIANWDGSQSTSTNLSMFGTFKLPSLYAAPEIIATSFSEQDDFRSTEDVSRTEIALRSSNIHAMRRQPEISFPFRLSLLQPKGGPPAANAWLINKLISHVVCSFSEREITESSCPPFIHQSTFYRSTNSICSDDPIVICQEISRKFAASKTGGDFSVWDAIASEQERIYDQRVSFDKWGHLSAAQAITIYLLMLTTEPERVSTHHPTLPITILFTLGAIFQHLNQIHPGFVAAEEQRGGRPTWEDWIFAESKLRTGTVYFILALIFDVDFGIPCDRETDFKFEDVELPAAKILWEARTELSWTEEFGMIVQQRDNSTMASTSDARLKYGDLVRLNKQESSHKRSGIHKDEHKLADRIEKWHKEIDDFGMLVALCGTMV